MSTDRASDENTGGQQPVSGNRNGARMYFSGATSRENNQSHEEGSSYASVDWQRPDSHPPVESISSEADPSPLGTASTHGPTTQDSSPPSASSEEEFAMGGQDAHAAPAAAFGHGKKLQFARPEPGFDPTGDHFVRQYHKDAGSTHHVLGHLRQPGPAMKERYLQSIDDLQQATGRAPTEQERDFIEKTLRKNTGWLEGYKATLEGQTTVPMAAFNRLAQDYEETILHVARDRAAYEADAMVSILSRDDQIGALQRELDAIRTRESGQREDLKSQLNALSEEIEQLRPQSSMCTSLEADMAELKEQTEQRVRNVIYATTTATRLLYHQRIEALEEQLEECKARCARSKLKMTSLDALADKVAQLRQENAHLRGILADHEIPGGDCRDYGATPSEADTRSEVGPRARDARQAPADAALQDETASGARGASPGYLLLKNAFAESQRLRVANKEVEILQGKLEQAEENQRNLRDNNGGIAPRLNRALERLAARDSEIALLQAQVVDAENRAARNLAAVNGQGRAGTVDEELLKQWRAATARNNLTILTELADEDDMLATWKDDVQKMFRGFQDGQMPKDTGEWSFDKPVRL